MEKVDGFESGYQTRHEPEPEDARVMVDFAVGSGGVGPAVGFGSGDFFPVVTAEDRPEGPASRDGTEHRDE